mmetsp:Transcript_30467/g.97217  ORF Transcript_30467/g.97217 Transcript_30467/m.97217 type:complete len:455 (-) Transcript_30467:561-1925(-)
MLVMSKMALVFLFLLLAQQLLLVLRRVFKRSLTPIALAKAICGVEGFGVRRGRFLLFEAPVEVVAVGALERKPALPQVHVFVELIVPSRLHLLLPTRLLFRERSAVELGQAGILAHVARLATRRAQHLFVLSSLRRRCHRHHGHHRRRGLRRRGLGGLLRFLLGRGLMLVLAPHARRRRLRRAPHAAALHFIQAAGPFPLLFANLRREERPGLRPAGLVVHREGKRRVALVRVGLGTCDGSRAAHIRGAFGARWLCWRRRRRRPLLRSTRAFFWFVDIRHDESMWRQPRLRFGLRLRLRRRRRRRLPVELFCLLRQWRGLRRLFGRRLGLGAIFVLPKEAGEAPMQLHPPCGTLRLQTVKHPAAVAALQAFRLGVGTLDAGSARTLRRHRCSSLHASLTPSSCCRGGAVLAGPSSPEPGRLLLAWDPASCRSATVARLVLFLSPLPQTTVRHST